MLAVLLTSYITCWISMSSLLWTHYHVARFLAILATSVPRVYVVIFLDSLHLGFLNLLSSDHQLKNWPSQIDFN